MKEEKSKINFWLDFLLDLLKLTISVCLGVVLGLEGQIYLEKWKESRLIPELDAEYVVDGISRQEQKYVEIAKGATIFFNPEENHLMRSSCQHRIIVRNNSSTVSATNVKLTVKVSSPARIYAIASEKYKPNPLCGGNSTEALIELKDLEKKKEVFILLGIAFPGSEISSLEKIGTISLFLESENRGRYNDTIFLFH